MNTRFKVFPSYNILQHLRDFIHVLIFVIVSNAEKSPKLTNIVIHYTWFGVVCTIHTKLFIKANRHFTSINVDNILF